MHGEPQDAWVPPCLVGRRAWRRIASAWGPVLKPCKKNYAQRKIHNSIKPLFLERQREERKKERRRRGEEEKGEEGRKGSAEIGTWFVDLLQQECTDLHAWYGCTRVTRASVARVSGGDLPQVLLVTFSKHLFKLRLAHSYFPKELF